jgi:hypothetical protein
MIPRNSFDSSLPGGNNLVISTGNNHTLYWLFEKRVWTCTFTAEPWKLSLYEGLPPRGLSGARRAGDFLNRYWSAAGMPCFGAAACIVPGEQSDNNSCIKTGYYEFLGKILNENKSREYQVFLRSSLLYRVRTLCQSSFRSSRSIDTTVYDWFSGGQHPSWSSRDHTSSGH